MTNIVCNNGVTISMNDNTLKLSDVYKDTNCIMNNFINTTFDKLDDTKNYILMLKDEKISKTLENKETKNVTIDLNVKDINTGQVLEFDNSGVFRLKSIDEKEDANISIYGEHQIINNNSTGVLYIDNVNIKSTGSVVVKNKGIFNFNNSVIFQEHSSTAISNDENGIINIENSNINSSKHEYISNNSSSNVTINGGELISPNANCISNNSSGNIIIVDNLGPVYVASFNDANKPDYWYKGIINKAIGNIYISGRNSDVCSNEANKTGICIYTEIGRSVLNETSATGNIYINGATIKSGYLAVNNYVGKIYICNSEVDGITYDVSNENGYVYYKDSNIFKNNSLNDTVNDPSHIILKSDLICEAK